LGNWAAVYQILEKNSDGNAIQGRVLAEDTHSSLLLSRQGLLATIGLKDMIVVSSGNAILVCPRDRTQEVRKIGETLREQTEGAAIHRPWGQYTVLEEGPGYKIKKIVVDPGQKLSLQRHQHRAEHWVVIEGAAKVIHGEETVVLRQNESMYIPMGQKHRLDNPGTDPLIIIEVQTGDYVGEDDIERFEDIYGRTTKAE
jgi:mannose-1-phosphate guanylyltransferase/mannose-6-phosphate isomerase